MRNVIQRAQLHPAYSKLYFWSKLITITGSAQIIIQIASLIGGLLVIRLLPQHEYALYTIANTMLGTMTLLTDSGISSGVMSIGGKVWQSPERLGAVVATGLRLRKKFAIGSLVIAVPILIYLLLFHGASWLTSLLIALSLIPAFFAALSDSLLEVAPKLHQDIAPLQKNQMMVGVSRLALIALLLFLFPWAFIAILATGIPRIYGNFRLKKIIEPFVAKQEPDKQVEKDILKIVKRVMPGSVYYCIISQVSIWLISFFGTTSSIAQVGALGRLGMMLSVFSVMVNTLAIPRFARLPDDRELLWNRFFQIMAALFALCFLIVGAIALFPQQILYLLGKQYANLQSELILSVTVSCLGLIYTTIFSLSLARGYVMKPVINIGVHLFFQIVLITLLNLSTARNVFIFSILDYTIITIMFTANFFYHTYKIESNQHRIAQQVSDR